MKTRIQVDCSKILDVSKLVGKPLNVISVEMGHTKSFLNNMVRDSTGGTANMAMSDYILFKSLYSEDIACKEKLPEEKCTEKETYVFDISEKTKYTNLFTALFTQQ